MHTCARTHTGIRRGSLSDTYKQFCTSSPWSGTDELLRNFTEPPNEACGLPSCVLSPKPLEPHAKLLTVWFKLLRMQCLHRRDDSAPKPLFIGTVSSDKQGMTSALEHTVHCRKCSVMRAVWSGRWRGSRSLGRRAEE